MVDKACKDSKCKHFSNNFEVELFFDSVDPALAASQTYIDVGGSDNDDDTDEGITDASMMAIAEHCSALRKLDLSFCQGMSDAGMIAVAQGCPLLESLELDDCEWVTEEAVDIIRETCPRLARLSSCFA